jgi:hypothetical protein
LPPRQRGLGGLAVLDEPCEAPKGRHLVFRDLAARPNCLLHSGGGTIPK